jgi:phosphoglycolate phosphatase-like HAD superfamily hydrolase
MTEDCALRTPAWLHDALANYYVKDDPMNSTALSPRDLTPEKDFFVGIDSDGCVFNSMDLKHKECFCPAFVNHFGLQGASNQGRETWEFVNLRSKTRGCNRFQAVVFALELLSKRPEIQHVMKHAVDPYPLIKWVNANSKLSGDTLEAHVKNLEGDIPPILERALAWTKDVAAAVERIVHDLPPIAEAVPALELMKGKADCMVVSQTPTADLEREWKEHGIDHVVRFIAGQEHGTKAEHLSMATGDKYGPNKVLMIGDAPGDYLAAKENQALFFPIIPGKEAQSWTELHQFGFEAFISQSFAGDYQQKLLDAFNASLPAHPPWEA